MNIKVLVGSFVITALTLLQSPAQEPQPVTQKPVATGEQITINVLGDVNRADRILLPKGATLLDAIAAAGGLSRLANPSRTTLIHKSPGEKPDIDHIDLKAVLAGKIKDITLRQGDTIVIGEVQF